MRALNMFSKILVAISASSADTVLASAIETARKYDAQIVVLHVVDPTPSYLGAADDNFGLIVEAMSAHGRKVVAHVRNVLDDQAPEAEVRIGYAADVRHDGRPRDRRCCRGDGC
jgi:nucleotide-binding universal stress UspA family protein